MKVFLAVLSVITAILAILYFSARQAAREQVANAQTAATAASNDMTVAHNELNETRAQLTQVERSAAEEQERSQHLLSTLTNQLAAAQVEVEQKQSRVDDLEKQNSALNSEIDVVAGQLDKVKQQLTALENTHESTVNNLRAMREDYVALVAQRAALEAKLHDLKALRAQIRAVKDELHAMKVAERARLERAETALGNGGFVMKEGSWVSIPRTPAGKFPLTEEITHDAAPAANP